MIRIRPDRELTIRPGVLLNQKYSLHAIARYRGTRVMPPPFAEMGCVILLPYELKFLNFL